MREVCQLFGVEKLRMTAYKPSTNQVERFHRTMNSILAKTVSDHQRDWDTRLPNAMAAYRATQHDATGYLPNMLVLGRETRAPPDLVYGVQDEDSFEVTYDKYVVDMHDRAVDAYYDVRVSLQKCANRNKKHYDLGLKQQTFKSGDWVLYFNPRKLRGKQMKWVRQFEGPFLVVSTPTSMTAKIQRSQKAQIRVVHTDKLKHFNGTPPKAWKLPVESAGSSENSHRAMAGTNSEGQGTLGSPPEIALDSTTDTNVVDGHVQFNTVEGCSPESVNVWPVSYTRCDCKCWK